MPGRTRVPRVRRDITNLEGLRLGLYVRVSRAKLAGNGSDADDSQRHEKSTEDQEKIGRQFAARNRMAIADVYRDDGLSASRFAAKDRMDYDFGGLVADIEDGRLDVIWFWELSRSQRDLEVFTEMRALCRSKGVLWAVNDRVYDPDNYMDMVAPTFHAVFDEMESELKSERVKRGIASNALAGKPIGMPPYGYKAVHDVQTGKSAGRKADIFDENGRAIEDTPAWVVREIFRRYKAGVGAVRIAEDLNARGVPTSPHKRAREDGRAREGATPRWWASTVMDIIHNPAYIRRVMHTNADPDVPTEIINGRRVLKDVLGQWRAIVDEVTFWDAQAIPTQPWGRDATGPEKPARRNPARTGRSPAEPHRPL